MRQQRSFQQYITDKKREFGERFDPSGLALKFQSYFESGVRIRVRFSHGEELTGTVGVTTGWKPAFLLIRTARSQGSPYLLGSGDEIVEVTKYQGKSH